MLLKNSSDNLAEEWAHLIWKGSTSLHSRIFTWPTEVVVQLQLAGVFQILAVVLQYWLKRWWRCWCDLHRRAVLVLTSSWWRVIVTCLMQISLQTQTRCWKSARAPDTGLYLGGLISGIVFSKHSSRLHLTWMRLQLEVLVELVTGHHRVIQAP